MRSGGGGGGEEQGREGGGEKASRGSAQPRLIYNPGGRWRGEQGWTEGWIGTPAEKKKKKKKRCVSTLEQ